MPEKRSEARQTANLSGKHEADDSNHPQALRSFVRVFAKQGRSSNHLTEHYITEVQPATEDFDTSVSILAADSYVSFVMHSSFASLSATS
jgi:hypothetical protein